MDQDNEQTTSHYKLDTRSHDPVLDVDEYTDTQPRDLELNAIGPSDGAPPGAGASSPPGDSDLDADGSDDPDYHPPAGPSSSPGPPTPEPNSMEDSQPNLPPRDDDPNPNRPDDAGHVDPGEPKPPPADPMSRPFTANPNAIDLDLWASYSNNIDDLNVLLAQLDAPRPEESELQRTMSSAPTEPPHRLDAVDTAAFRGGGNEWARTLAEYTPVNDAPVQRVQDWVMLQCRLFWTPWRECEAVARACP
ncbi:hypothetical protein CI238_01101 [Colletotrichum incanum]|uniref:Uncharacterized protein n=1 Tax=Colletotrichum incanum TaxID=1573173 RepID=A0A161W7Z6_COLIC|nr:hypothetical protein CI238_01101 [Colletotrichum incanum]